MINLTGADMLEIFQAYLKCDDKPNFTKTHNLGSDKISIYNCDTSMALELFDKLYCENKSDLMELIGILYEMNLIENDDLLSSLHNRNVEFCYHYGITKFPIHQIIANQSTYNLLSIPNIIFYMFINYLTHKQEMIDNILQQYCPMDRDRLSQAFSMLPDIYLKYF